MPEGDTIHRTAAALRTALVGTPLVRFEAPRLVGPRPTPGRVVETVESSGKHLEITWDDGLVLHTHMRMTGSWHLYRTGERWQRPLRQMRVHLQVADWSAVCFNAPVVETYRQFDRRRHPGLGRLGPDLCRPDADLAEAAQRLYQYPDQTRTVAEVLLDQHVACGVGNVYRSEVLWACQQYPFATVASLGLDDCTALVTEAARQLQANLHHSARHTVGTGTVGIEHDVHGRPIRPGLAVYGRNVQRCWRCGDTIEVTRHGEHARVLYWCPGCQVNHAPRLADGDVDRGPRDEAEMDPHPAAAKFLRDLPWRRNDTPPGLRRPLAG